MQNNKQKAPFFSLNIRWRIFGLSFVLIFCLVSISGYSIWQMSAVSNEIEVIAEEDMPLTKMLTALTIHQLEQAVLVERYLAVTFEKNSASAGTLRDIAVKVKKLRSKINVEFDDINEILQSSLSHTKMNDRRVVLLDVTGDLDYVRSLKDQYTTVVTSFLDGKVDSNNRISHDTMEKLLETEDELDHKLEALLVKVESLTEKALLRVEAHEKTALWGISFGTAAAFMLAVIMSIVIIRSIIIPLYRITNVMSELADGQLDVLIKDTNRHDEVGKMALAVEQFKLAAQHNKELERDAHKLREKQQREEEELRTKKEADRMQKENLARTEQEKKEAQLNELTKAINGFEEKIAVITTSISSISEKMFLASNTLSDNVTRNNTETVSAAAASKQASQNVQAVSAAAEELSSSIVEISRQVANCSTTTSESVENVSLSHHTVTELVNSVQQISEVVELISDIAAQTNLLALNATIEAARAGEAGKGFAVVADEVKNLAKQTAIATEKISQQIEAIQSKTNNAATSIVDIKDSVGVINEIASTIASAVEEQSAATKEIAESVSQASMGTNKVSENIDQVTKITSETTIYANDFETSAQELSNQSSNLKNEVDDFIKRVSNI